MTNILLFPSGEQIFPSVALVGARHAGEGQGSAPIPAPPARLTNIQTTGALWPRTGNGGCLTNENCDAGSASSTKVGGHHTVKSQCPADIFSDNLVEGSALNAFIPQHVRLGDEPMTDTYPSEVHEPQQLQTRNSEGQFCSIADFKEHLAKQEELHDQLRDELYPKRPIETPIFDWFKSHSMFIGWGGFAASLIYMALMSGAWVAFLDMGF